jgi:hypothetical protein
MPFAIAEISIPIKKLIKSSMQYEFDLNSIVDDCSDFNFEEAKVISLKGVIWQQLGGDAFIEWYKYFNLKNSTMNSLLLALRMFKRLLGYAYDNIEKAEEEYKKKKIRELILTRKTKEPVLTQKREVIF